MGDPARFESLGLPVIADSMVEFPGPLAGVLAGMDWAAAQGAEHILTVAADTPFFPVDLQARLADAREGGGGSDCSGGNARGRIGYTVTPPSDFWPVALREDLRRALKSGLRKVVLWTDQHGCAEALFAVDPHDPFFNINRPEDLAQAEAMA